MYGLLLVVGEYGAWKSFYTHRLVTSFKYQKAIRIGNYSSPDFHLRFSSVEDLVEVLTAVYNYKKDPKNQKQRIIIVVDEAAIYFNARDFKNFPPEILHFLVQLRKLNVLCVIVAQDLKMIDINFRRLCYNVRKYYSFFRIVRMHRDFELLSEDANLNDEMNTIMSRPYFSLGPWLTLFVYDNILFRWLLSVPFFGSSLYNTHELILPDYSCLDRYKLKQLFPYTKVIDEEQSYRDHTKAIESMYFSVIEKIKNSRLLRYYKKVRGDDLPPPPPDLLPEGTVKNLTIYYKKDFASCYLDTVYVATDYTDDLRKRILGWKYKNHTEEGAYLSSLLERAYKQLSLTPDTLIVPVPASSSSRNHTQILAEALGTVTPCVQKNRATDHQTDHDRQGRILNVRGAYILDPQYDVSWKSVLLIDDLITSGSTLNEIALILKQSWAQKVSSLTLTRNNVHTLRKQGRPHA